MDRPHIERVTAAAPILFDEIPTESELRASKRPKRALSSGKRKSHCDTRSADDQATHPEAGRQFFSIRHEVAIQLDTCAQ